MTEYVVVDASIAVKWILMEPFSIEARSVAEAWASAGFQPIAPTLLFAEVANALYKRVRRGGLIEEDAVALMRELLGAGIQPRDEGNLYARALQIAHALGQPACYDALYLALAEREGCECWTADERLWNAVRQALPWTRWVGEPSAAVPGA